MIENSMPVSIKMKERLLPTFAINPNPILNSQQSIFLIGSCFSDAMLARFQQRNIHAITNPFGTIYHPIPLLLELRKIINIAALTAMDNQAPTQHNQTDQLFQFNQKYHSLQHASRFSDNNPQALEETIISTRDNAATQLKQASTVIITLGTAWYYYHQPTHAIVGNCHKLPGQQFQKNCSSVGEISRLLQDFFNEATALFPNKTWIITVSPVRHLRDGLSQNLLSKSILHSATFEFLQNSNSSQIHYFPAYEIQREELNDYRFFKDDLMHPTPWAEDYIFQRFTETFYSASEQEILIQNFNSWKQSQHR
jgi:hypothetical protein